MKIVIASVLTLAALAALCIPFKKKKNGIILALYALGMILFFAVYNIRTIGYILPFYQPTDQSMYQKEFFEAGEYPDAFLNDFFAGKKVYTPNDAYDVLDEHNMNDPDASDYDEEGNYWLYQYYHAVNMWNYLDFAKAEVIKDDTLSGLVLSKEQKSHYFDLGRANDMMRYTSALTPYMGEWGNGFYYYWFYNSFIEDSRIYICPEDMDGAKELVMIWQRDGDVHDTDSFYIASRTYFDEVINR